MLSAIIQFYNLRSGLELSVIVPGHCMRAERTQSQKSGESEETRIGHCASAEDSVSEVRDESEVGGD